MHLTDHANTPAIELLIKLYEDSELFVQAGDIKKLMRRLSACKNKIPNRNRQIFFYSEPVDRVKKIYRIYTKHVFRKVLPLDKVI